MFIRDEYTEDEINKYFNEGWDMIIKNDASFLVH